MAHYELPVTQHPDLGDSRHVTFYHAAELMSLGWRRLIADHGVIDETDVAVVQVAFTYLHEIHTEKVGVSAVVDHVGNSSIRFALTMDQAGRNVATGNTTIVKTLGDRTSSSPLTDVERSKLHALQPELPPS